MKRYLTWLETTPESEEIDVVPVVVAPGPAGKTPPAVVASPPMALPISMPAGKIPVATLVPKSAPPAGVDVELVPPPPAAGNKWLSHRDMILLGSGAAVIGMLILGVLIAVLMMRNQ
jgi:hypothetical protein